VRSQRVGRQPPRESISDLKSSDLKGTEENSLRIPHSVESPSAIRSHDRRPPLKVTFELQTRGWNAKEARPVFIPRARDYLLFEYSNPVVRVRGGGEGRAKIAVLSLRPRRRAGERVEERGREVLDIKYRSIDGSVVHIMSLRVSLSADHPLCAAACPLSEESFFRRP